MLRTGRKGLAAATLILDALKGTAAVLVADRFGGQDLAVLAGLGAFLGHLFPVWLKFKGGKGVATYIGVLIGLAWQGALVFCLVWLAIAALTRYSSLAALVASAAAPLLAWYLKMALEVIMVVGFMALLLVWRHRDNIARLLAGKEARIGAKPPSPPEDPSAA